MSLSRQRASRRIGRPQRPALDAGRNHRSCGLGRDDLTYIFSPPPATNEFATLQENLSMCETWPELDKYTAEKLKGS